jgi:hypothetical protein
MNREAELKRPSRVACSDLLDRWTLIIVVQILNIIVLLIDFIVEIYRRGF